MSEIGDGEQKPWSRETCRRRYVEGNALGLRGLSKLSGVSFAKLTEWSRKDKLDSENRTWPKQREQYQGEIRSKTFQKSAESISDKYAQENTKAVEQHIELSARQRDLAGVFLSAVSTKVNSITQPNKVSASSLKKADELINIFKDVGGRVPLQVCANILSQAIDIERRSRHLDLADPAIIEKAANRHGLSLIDFEAEVSEEMGEN